jgi:sulfite reductase beta subunit-like hemoprotein
VLADIAGGHWPELARKAAVALTANAQDSNPIASLLLDIYLVFLINHAQRLFSRTLVEGLTGRSADRPWAEARRGKEINELWLAQQLRSYGIRPRTIWIGDSHAKGYYLAELQETMQRYVPKAEAQAYLDELKPKKKEPPAPASPEPPNPA